MHDRPTALAVRATPSRCPSAFEEHVRAFERDAIREAEVSDSLDQMTERRVAALEEVLAARGPARLLAAWRLGRKIRRSADAFAWAGPSFYARRAEAVNNEWLAGR